jgi:hypothetical protein
MKKNDYLKKYWKEAYDRMLKQSRDWHREHPDQARVLSYECCRKGGKYYKQKLLYDRTGLRGERSKIRVHDATHFNKLKHFFAQESQIHHQWVPGTAEHTGIALVEKDKHMHGIIDVILILEGQITLLTEEQPYLVT